MASQLVLDSCGRHTNRSWYALSLVSHNAISVPNTIAA